MFVYITKMKSKTPTKSSVKTNMVVWERETYIFTCFLNSHLMWFVTFVSVKGELHKICGCDLWGSHICSSWEQVCLCKVKFYYISQKHWHCIFRITLELALFPSFHLSSITKRDGWDWQFVLITFLLCHLARSFMKSLYHDGITWWQDDMMGWLARFTRKSWGWQTISENHFRAIVVISLSVVLNCFRYNHIPFSWQVAFSFIIGHLSFIIRHH